MPNEESAGRSARQLDRTAYPIGGLLDRVVAWSISCTIQVFGATIFDILISIAIDENTIEFPIQITFNPNHYI